MVDYISPLKRDRIKEKLLKSKHVKKNKLTIGFAGTPELAYRHFLKISNQVILILGLCLLNQTRKLEEAKN